MYFIMYSCTNIFHRRSLYFPLKLYHQQQQQQHHHHQQQMQQQQNIIKTLDISNRTIDLSSGMAVIHVIHRALLCTHRVERVTKYTILFNGISPRYIKVYTCH